MAQSQPRIRPVPIDRYADRVARPRNNLPNALTRFIGREQEVAAISALLATNRLLTLTGSGGCGKTRLALAVAAGQNARVGIQPDGIWLVEFAALTDPALVPQAVAAVLGIREEPQRSLRDTLADALNARAPLLVLDNCEHVVSPIAEMVDALLRACPRLRILATSREALHVPGEVTWRVPSLSLPDDAAEQTAARLAQSEAVQLFVDRARLRQPSFLLTDENAATVAAICRRLDGMPLALELAAARASLLSLPQLERRLDDALRLLTGGARTVLPRHRTLRATLDWSFALLTEAERIVLRRLAVFVGGCRLAAVEAVCGGAGIAREEVLALLARLAEKSLVQVEERDDEDRYRLLETVRQYAREQLNASGEAARIGQIHADWYRSLAERVGPTLNGPEMVAALDRFEDEHDNLRATLRWLRETRQIEPGLRCCGNMFLFWYARSYVHEGRQWFDAFLALAAGRGSPAVSAATLAFTQYSAGRLAIYQGDYVAAATLLENSLATARADANSKTLTFALTQLGHLALYRGDFTTAKAWYAEGLAIRRTLDDPRGIAIMIGSLGRIALFAGEIAEARALLEESLAIFRHVVAYTDTVGILCDLGYVAIEQGDHTRARAYIAEALICSQEWDIKQGSAQCLEGFAVLSVARRQPERAVRLAGAAAALRRTINSPPPPVLQEWLTRALAPARQTLSGRKYREAFTAGAALPIGEAVAEALTSEASATAPGDRRTARERFGGLSAREQAVTIEIARGKTNREIAEALFITEKTVEWHVTNSLRKLGFRARSELAVWAVAAALAPVPPPPDEDRPFDPTPRNAAPSKVLS